MSMKNKKYLSTSPLREFPEKHIELRYREDIMNMQYRNFLSLNLLREFPGRSNELISA